MKIIFMISCCVWVLMIWYTVTIAQYSRSNFEVLRFELCNINHELIKFSGNITKRNGNQFLDCNVSTPIPLGDNLGLTCLIETKIAKNSFAELFTVREKNLCKAANSLLGEFWYDIERAAQFPAGACPIPAGKYLVHHLKLDFTKMTLQTFPFGTLRFTLKAVDHRNKNAEVWCMLVEVENKVL